MKKKRQQARWEGGRAAAVAGGESLYIKSATENNAQILFERGAQLKTGGQSNIGEVPAVQCITHLGLKNIYT